MRQVLPDYFVDDPGATIDRRARMVGGELSNAITIELQPSYSAALLNVSSSSVYPSAIIREDGHIFVMSAGGSALIWVCGEPNSKQLEATERVYRVLRSMGAPFGFSQIPFEP